MIISERYWGENNKCTHTHSQTHIKPQEREFVVRLTCSLTLVLRRFKRCLCSRPCDCFRDLRVEAEWAHIHISHNFTTLPHFLRLDCGRMKCESASRVEPQLVRSFTVKMVSIVVALACLRLMMLHWL